jgi:glycosyltransferase involved in cell wall biosynthesis
MSIKLSVVIPTYNRAQTLHQALALLAPQAESLSDSAEIIVIDDGSNDDTALVVANSAAGYPVPLLYEYQVNRGPASARNKGVEIARGEKILFLGDDIYAQPGLLQGHLHAYEHLQPDTNLAVLGYVTWNPDLSISPFMQWWGRQRLRYPPSLEPGFVETWRFYTCNVSLHRNFMLSVGGFDEAFREAAYEDTEFAFRLSKHGLRLYFFPQALGYHHHLTDLSEVCQQMESAGKSFDLFYSKTHYPGMPWSWRLISKGPWMTPALVRPLMQVANHCQYRFSSPLLWILVLAYSFLVGRGLKPPIKEMA